ncbi:hypothetical protein AB0P17_20605 [Streptomyces sp. NPDC088124]|uniref:hypothetical protein n=1 Tax=Streptomyces sp. NPDC088124 TaxID=3154654 RepID=UPI00343229DF
MVHPETKKCCLATCDDGVSSRTTSGTIGKALPRCNLPPAAAAVSSAFDDPNLIAYGGLEPVVRLAERCGLPAPAGERVRLSASKDGTGAFPAAKPMSLTGGMAAGADSIDDMDRLRHGAMVRHAPPVPWPPRSMPGRPPPPSVTA